MRRHRSILFIILCLAVLLLAYGLSLRPVVHKPPVAAPVTISAPVLYQETAKIAELPPQPPAPPVLKKRTQKPAVPLRIALIIDDVGLSRAQTMPVIDLPAPITLAFLPYGMHVRELAEKAAAAGHTVLLHMPMQPTGEQNPGPAAIEPGLDAETIATRLREALDKVPHAVGVNNHMGSAATADAALMHDFMQALAVMPSDFPGGLFFLDSYTSMESVAYEAALQTDVRALRRDVFLDNDPTPEAINAQLARVEAIAAQKGYAIAIGHPYPVTLAAIQEWYKRLDARGIMLVSVADLLNTDLLGKGGGEDYE